MFNNQCSIFNVQGKPLVCFRGIKKTPAFIDAGVFSCRKRYHIIWYNVNLHLHKKSGLRFRRLTPSSAGTLLIPPQFAAAQKNNRTLYGKHFTLHFMCGTFFTSLNDVPALDRVKRLAYV